MNSREYMKPWEVLKPTDILFGRRLLDERHMFYLLSTNMARALVNLF